MSIRAEEADVIPSIQKLRPDGLTTTELPGIALLESETYSAMPTEQLVEEVAAVIALPVADPMDSTPSMLNLVPLLTSKPWFATLSLREHLASQGYDLPTSW